MTKAFTSVKFQADHIDLMSLRPEELAGHTPEVAKIRISEWAAQSTQALTYMYDGRVIAIMGFILLWDGVIQGWVVPSTYVYSVPVGFAKTVRRFIESIAETFKCHRFQSGSYDDEFHDRWMTWLGFEREGVSKMFTPDKKNYVNYARFFTWHS